jgi:hypothetical protein
MLLYNGVIKLGLHQFGVPDLGDALISQGEMSPMGLLSRMVGFSPTFQFLAGVAEVGAAAALIWRRTAAVGALITLASMSFVLVLNLGYDMPGKELSIALLVMAAVVLAPWCRRLLLAVLTPGGVPDAPRPAFARSARGSRVLTWVGPIAGWATLALVGTLVLAVQPSRTVDEGAPAGVWAVQAETPVQADDPEAWQRVALGEVATNGELSVQVRTVSGDLLTGTYRRDGDVLEMELRPLREEGLSVAEYAQSPSQQVTVTVEDQGEDTLLLHGDHGDLELTRDPEGTALYDRGFHWGLSPDDPFER